MTNEPLSPHFNLREFLRSETAARMGIEIVPAAADIENLKRLCIEVLEPIRIQLGQPLVISSGLRPKWLNEAIGGSLTSAHMDGRAADFNAIGMTPVELSRWIRNRGFAGIDQCINEFGQWCHIGIAKTGAIPRDQYLTAIHINGKTVYSEGV